MPGLFYFAKDIGYNMNTWRGFYEPSENLYLYT
jgi:hypothetical protein